MIDKMEIDEADRTEVVPEGHVLRLDLRERPHLGECSVGRDPDAHPGGNGPAVAARASLTSTKCSTGRCRCFGGTGTKVPR